MHVACYLDVRYPDPFAGITTIVYTLSHVSVLTLEVCDEQSGRVRLLASGTRGAGEYAVQWDGTDDEGRAAADGPYWTRLTVHAANGRVFMQTRAITLRRGS